MPEDNKKELEDLFSPNEYVCPYCSKTILGDTAFTIHANHCYNNKYMESVEKKTASPDPVPEPDKCLKESLKGLLT